MELCAGTLYDVIKGVYEGPPIGSRREVLRQIALGLKYLHEKDIVHGNIKPHNILFSVSSDREAPVMIKLTLLSSIRQLDRKGKRASCFRHYFTIRRPPELIDV